MVVEHDAATRTVVFKDKLTAFAKHWGFRPRAYAPYRARTKVKTEKWRWLRQTECDRWPRLPKLGSP